MLRFGLALLQQATAGLVRPECVGVFLALLDSGLTLIVACVLEGFVELLFDAFISWAVFPPVPFDLRDDRFLLILCPMEVEGDATVGDSCGADIDSNFTAVCLDVFGFSLLSTRRGTGLASILAYVSKQQRLSESKLLRCEL